MRPLKFALAFCVVLALAAGDVAIFGGNPRSIRCAAGRESFDPALVKRGAELAAIGNCDVCHTAPGGRDSPADVRCRRRSAASTPPTSRRTETGIGAWSEAAFRRAMRRAWAAPATALPGFPLRPFHLVSDDDDEALYAYLMTREPVARRARRPAAVPARRPARDVRLESSVPPSGPVPRRRRADAAWNRGAYLAEGLGHCGACHTPRNARRGKDGRKFAGGEVEGWTAYALNAASPAPVPWNAAALGQYLRHGFERQHGVARGPMAEVASDLRGAPNDDVRAIAIYIAEQMNRAAPEQPSGGAASGVQLARGKADRGRERGQPRPMSLRAGDTENEKALYLCRRLRRLSRGPARACRMAASISLLYQRDQRPERRQSRQCRALRAAGGDGAPVPIMPGFADALDDAQIAALAAYVRAQLYGQPPWPTSSRQRCAQARSACRTASSSTVR